MQTDNQLIRRIKKKQDKKAADELIRRYYREIYAFTYRQTGERELALDLTQEIFITVLQGIYAFDEKKAGFRTWAYRVAANRITDYYRSKSYKKEKLQQPLQWETEEDSVMQKECRAIVEKQYQSGRVCGKESKKFTGDRAFVPYFIRAEVSGLLLPVCIWESDGSDSCMPSSPKRRG